MRRRLETLLLRLLLLLSVLAIATSALDCIQCGHNDHWYHEVDNEKRIEQCSLGLLPASPCANVSHTHCIVNWYRTGGSSVKTVTQRHCGMESDVTGCTLYNSKISRKVRRHLLTRDDASGSMRKETASMFVEVCSTSCPSGECVNSSNGATIYVILTLVAFFWISS